MSSEIELLAEAFGYGWADLRMVHDQRDEERVPPFDERLRLINTVIKPGFAAARASSDERVSWPREPR